MELKSGRKGSDSNGCCKRDMEPFKAECESLIRIPGKILIIDDEVLLSTAVSKMIEFLGCKTILAPDGLEGIKILKENKGKISMVLLDLGLPYTEPAELLQELISTGGNIPILIFSGHDIADVQYLLDQGAEGFLEKPVTFERLKETLTGLFPQEKS